MTHMSNSEMEQHQEIEIAGYIGMTNFNNVEKVFDQYKMTSQMLDRTINYIREEKRNMRSTNPYISEEEINNRLHDDLNEYKFLVENKHHTSKELEKNIEISNIYYNNMKTQINAMTDKSRFFNIKDGALTRVQQILDKISLMKTSMQ